MNWAVYSLQQLEKLLRLNPELKQFIETYEKKRLETTTPPAGGSP